MTSERKLAHRVRLETGNLMQFFIESDGTATASIEYDDYVSAISKTREEAITKMTDLLSEFISPKLLRKTVHDIQLTPGRINLRPIRDREGRDLTLSIAMIWEEHAPRHEGSVHLGVRMKSFSKSAPTLAEAAKKLKTSVLRLPSGSIFFMQFIEAMDTARRYLTFLDELESTRTGGDDARMD